MKAVHKAGDANNPASRLEQPPVSGLPQTPSQSDAFEAADALLGSVDTNVATAEASRGGAAGRKLESGA